MGPFESRIPMDAPPLTCTGLWHVYSWSTSRLSLNLWRWQWKEREREKTLQFVPLNCYFLVMRQFWINMDRPNCTQNALCVVYDIANYKLELPINQVYPLTPRMDQL